MNSINYIEILDKCLVRFGRDYYANRYFLHQDNSSIHKSEECEQFIEAERIKWVCKFLTKKNIFHQLKWIFTKGKVTTTITRPQSNRVSLRRLEMPREKHGLYHFGAGRSSSNRILGRTHAGKVWFIYKYSTQVSFFMLFTQMR
jgi:hypothetical protein